MYFAMAFDQPFVWQDQMTEVTRQDTLADGTVEQEITFVPVFRADFGQVEELNVHVALSFCDTDGALANLAAEAQAFDFDAYKASNERRWDEQLGHIGGWRILRRTDSLLFGVVPCDDGAQLGQRRGRSLPRHRPANSPTRPRRRRPLHCVQPVGYLPSPPPSARLD